MEASSSPEIAAPALAHRLPLRILLPYLLAALLLALAYGSSFLLADALQTAGFEASSAGTVVGTGIMVTLVGSVFAGLWAERLGIVRMIAGSCALLICAMVCFALLAQGGMPVAIAGGLLLGLGWAICYMLAPIQLIQCLQPAARLEALTLLSGSQMLGMGLSAPLGHWVARHAGGVSHVFWIYAGLCLLALALMLLLVLRLEQQPQLPLKAVALTWAGVAKVLKSPMATPVLLIAIAACSFTGLSTFQSLYARSRGLSPDLFFITFTMTTVALRFTVASWIGRLPAGRLCLGLFALMLCGLALLIVNTASAALYICATLLFSLGYGLTYATLNAMAVNLAGTLNLSIPVASQVFTLGYFGGAFGFPYVAGRLIALSGIDMALLLMAGLVAVNLLIAATSSSVQQMRRS